MARVKSHSRRLKERGGLWLIVLGLSEISLKELLIAMRGQHPDQSITVLVDGGQNVDGVDADEIWVFDRMGMAGLLAMLRRASWRHFDRVYHCAYQGSKPRCIWLKWLIWPRPDWYIFELKKHVRD